MNASQRELELVEQVRQLEFERDRAVLDCVRETRQRLLAERRMRDFKDSVAFAIETLTVVHRILDREDSASLKPTVQQVQEATGLGRGAAVRLMKSKRQKTEPSEQGEDGVQTRARILALFRANPDTRYPMSAVRDELGLTDGQTKGALRRLNAAGDILARHDAKARTFWGLPSVGLPFEPKNTNGVSSTSPTPPESA